MRAMVLEAQRTPLQPADIPEPEPGPGELLVRVSACGVCRTDLHIVDGELTKPKLPLVIGHQIVGEVVGEDRRVGILWLGWTDGECRYCRAGLENLCDRAQFTGYDRDGGYAAYAVADARYCFPIPDGYEDLDAAPLLCAGLIGYRALRFAGDAEVLGLYGFGASAHIVTQVARLLWGERVVRSVANLTRRDGEELLALASKIPIRTEIERFGLEDANDALDRLRSGRIRGAAVLDVTGKRGP